MWKFIDIHLSSMIDEYENKCKLAYLHTRDALRTILEHLCYLCMDSFYVKMGILLIFWTNRIESCQKIEN